MNLIGEGIETVTQSGVNFIQNEIRQKKISNYIMVQTTSNVNFWMKRGWQPYGPPFVFGDNIQQAMVKYEDDE